MNSRLDSLIYIVNEVVSEGEGMSYQMPSAKEIAEGYMANEDITNEQLEIIRALLVERSRMLAAIKTPDREKDSYMNLEFNRSVENFLEGGAEFDSLDDYIQSPVRMFKAGDEAIIANRIIKDISRLKVNMNCIFQKSGMTHPSLFNRLPRDVVFKILGDTPTVLPERDAQAIIRSEFKKP